MKFQIGDKVSYIGWVGTVISVDASIDYPVKAQFKDEDNVHEESFTADGRLNVHHKRPSLTLVSREKKRQLIRLYRAIYWSPDKKTWYVDPRLFRSETEAKEHRPDQFIKLIATRPIVVEDLS